MSDFPEAPASATVKVKSENGFEWLFTVRSDTVHDPKTGIMMKIESLEQDFKKKNWTPLSNGGGFKKKEEPVYVEGEKCPLDGGRLVIPPAGTNRPIKCENNKYNFQTKQSYGCVYIKWADKGIPERQINSV